MQNRTKQFLLKVFKSDAIEDCRSLKENIDNAVSLLTPKAAYQYAEIRIPSGKQF